MTDLLTPDQLRSLSESGRLAQKVLLEKKMREEKEQEKANDLWLAFDVITETEERMRQAASIGTRESYACVLRDGIHFEDGFLGKSPWLLGTIGKTIYEHFISRGFEVSFRRWEDGMRDLGEDTGYEVIVSW